MLAVSVCAVALVQVIGHKPELTRVQFDKRLNRLLSMPSPPQVEKIRSELGEPDEITREKSSGNHWIAWRYGTEGSGSLATLCEVWMVEREYKGKKVTWPDVVGRREGHQPIQNGLIPERELRNYLQFLWSLREEQSYFHDPRSLINASNRLRKLGRNKALAVVKEYSRVAWSDREFPFWLARVLFKPKDHSGFFRRAGLGAYGVEGDSSPSWPTAPILWGRDVPFNLFRGGLLRGSPEHAYNYISEFENEWNIRTRDLTPPDDPFLAYEQAVDSPQFPFPRKQDGGGYVIPWWVEEGHVLQQVLIMVKSVYRPAKFWSQAPGGRSVNGRDFEKYHREFLAVGAKWDSKRGDYVVPN